MVLDPFCGCATACIAAEAEHRRWVGIDISPKAAELVKIRMEKEIGLFYGGAHRVDIPQCTDNKSLRRYNDPVNKRALYGEQGGHCNGCGEHFRLQNLTVDHIIARNKGRDGPPRQPAIAMWALQLSKRGSRAGIPDRETRCLKISNKQAPAPEGTSPADKWAPASR